LPAATWWKFALYAHLSRPVADRAIYRTLHKAPRQAPRRSPIRSLVELGIGKGVRTERSIAVALRYAEADSIRYTGVDLFEARPKNSSGMSLKEAFRWSKSLGVKAELIPGDPLSALARAANRLMGTDLLVISADQDRDALAQAWFYVPRMLSSHSIVLLEESDGEATSFRTVPRQEIESLAATGQAARRAA
jgi:hypothetical protein